MAVSAAEVKALRDLTGAGMMDCKRALQEAGGDVEKAKDLLRQQGLAKGEKRAGRATAEGCIAIALTDDAQSAVALELNCETDFVGRTDDFRALAADAAVAALTNQANDLEGLGLGDRVNEAVSKLGEVIRIGGVSRWAAAEGGQLGYYLHTATHRVAVLVELGVAGVAAEVAAEVAKEIGMQVAAMQPLCVSRDQVPADKLDHEKEMLLQAADMANKPPQIQEKIIEGRLGKYYSEVCLLEQEYAKDADKTVQKYLDEQAKAAGGELTVRRFERLEVGREA